MGRPYSVDLRERVVRAVIKGGLSCHQAAAQFGVGIAEAALMGRLKMAYRPPRIDCLHRVPDNHLLDMLALRTFERQKVGMGGTRFDTGQHHPALTPRAAGPLDGKQRRAGMTIGFGHDASPPLGGSATLSVIGRCRYEGR